MNKIIIQMEKYKNELIIWGCIFLFGIFSMIFYTIMI